VWALITDINLPAQFSRGPQVMEGWHGVRFDRARAPMLLSAHVADSSGVSDHVV
jgi:hypothetical protein